MSVAPAEGLPASAFPRRVTVPEIQKRKSPRDSSRQPQSKIVCLTAYDYPTARALDEAGIDVLLVGDSLGMAVLGYESTLPVTVDEILHHARAVVRGASHALVVADMPFGSYQTGPEEAIRHAVRLIKEAGVAAVKLEGGERRLDLIARLVDAEIPVMGHVGLTPQSVNVVGGYTVQGRTVEAAERVLRDARAVEAAGAFSIVLESVPRELAARITAELRIPTIGIGAGPDCDGQILVFHDFAGWNYGHVPKFVRVFANLREEITQAAAGFREAVQSGTFPNDEESYHAAGELREKLVAEKPPRAISARR
jgi:3-methyl-2-oxobutanoate hydroxymethyltransferase